MCAIHSFKIFLDSTHISGAFIVDTTTLTCMTLQRRQVCMRSSVPDADRLVLRPRVDPAFDHRHRQDLTYARSNTAFVNFLSSTKHASDTTQEDLKEWVSSCNQKHDGLVIIMRSKPKTPFRWMFFKDTGTKINMNPIIFVKVTSNSIKSLFL